MGNVCPCPKRNKKKEFTYDVHEETFEMDENIQNIGEHSPKNEVHDHDHENNILTEDLRSSEEGPSPLRHHSEEQLHPKEPEELRRVDHFQPISSNQISVQMKIEEEQQSLPLIQQPPVVIQQKPVFQTNVLKPKTVKKKYNPDDYRFINESGSFKVKKIDSIKEQQYNIDNCKDCHFFIFDITANLYIDDCEGCTIFVAPCQSTIFIRNCKRMVLVAATKQFRTYECHDCVFSLYCKSQPVIESSSNLQFTPFRCPVYADLPRQFSKTRLEPWNNHWSQIFNFTKKEGERHFSLHENAQLDIDWPRAFGQAQLEMSELKNPIPLSVGDLPYEPRSEVLILVHKGVPDDVIQQKLEGTVILKTFQGVIAGEGKDEKKAILIDALDHLPQQYEQIGRIFTNPSEIATNKGKWFVSFSDEREK